MRNFPVCLGVDSPVRLHSAITATALLLTFILSIGCNRGPEINGAFDVSFVWGDGKLQSAKVHALEPARSPSPAQQKVIARLSESYIVDNVRAANLKRGSGVVQLRIFGSPPYLVQVASFAITEPDFSELKAAVESEDIGKIRALAMRYGNVNQRELPSRQTALAVASAGRHDASVKVLLELGADANSADEIGVTPLMNAVVAGDLTAVKTLIASSANASATNKAGDSAGSLAKKLRRDQILRLLSKRPQRQ